MPVRSEILVFGARNQPNGGDVARFSAKNQMKIASSWSFFAAFADFDPRTIDRLGSAHAARGKSCAFG
jgi:hypothetical protein